MHLSKNLSSDDNEDLYAPSKSVANYHSAMTFTNQDQLKIRKKMEEIERKFRRADEQKRN